MRPGVRYGLHILLSSALVTGGTHAEELKDPYYGEALFFAHQGLYFEALERLDSEVAQHAALDEPVLDSLWYHIDDAEFALGDFELRYRMHQRAGRAIRAVLEGAVDELTRNDAAYRLARIQFRKGQFEEAAQSLGRIEGVVPSRIREEIEFLRANIDLALQQPSRAIPILKALQDSDEFGAFAAYNLGIAMRSAGQPDAALAQLARAGQVNVDDEPSLAIRDKSNLVLGTILLEGGRFDEANLYLGRVRLDGPYSNRALLSAGWASLSAEAYDRAVVPWSILVEREVTDGAVQEAILALPYAYGRLGLFARAASFYGVALDTFGDEVARLDSSIQSIRDGHFLEALTREEVRKDRDWVIRLRSLPDAPETYYLMDLLAAHGFQTGLDNYLDLADLARKLERWRAGFDAYDELIAMRRAHYEPLLPVVDAEFRALDSRLRLRVEQHALLVRRRDALLTAPRPEFLATRAEQTALTRLAEIEKVTGADSAVRQRIRRLRGLLLWDLETEYHERLSRFDEHLRALGDAIEATQAEYEQFVRARQAATHSFAGYAGEIGRLRTRAEAVHARVERTMVLQGRELEVAAIDELRGRRDRLDNYRDKVRYALADSYDRASQTQARAGSNGKPPLEPGKDDS